MATKMNSCMCLCETTGRLTELDFPDMLRTLLRRLPICVQNKFAQLSFDKDMMGMSATFSNPTKLVSNSAKFAETEWAQHCLRRKNSIVWKKLQNIKNLLITGSCRKPLLCLRDQL